jgi:hypothetical protein
MLLSLVFTYRRLLEHIFLLIMTLFLSFGNFFLIWYPYLKLSIFKFNKFRIFYTNVNMKERLIILKRLKNKINKEKKVKEAKCHIWFCFFLSSYNSLIEITTFLSTCRSSSNVSYCYAIFLILCYFKNLFWLAILRSYCFWSRAFSIFSERI